MHDNSFLKNILVFFFIFIGIYVIKNINNVFIATIIVYFVGRLFFKYKPSILENFEDGPVRYTLLCHTCNWEWMSNVTDKKYSKKCPNCGDDSKIEVIGVRKVSKAVKRSNKDLTSYFRKQK